MCRLLAFALGVLFGSIHIEYIYKNPNRYILELSDCVKSIIAVLIFSRWFDSRINSENFLLMCYVCFGVIIGHNYLVYNKFGIKENIAVYWGVILSFWRYNFLLMFFCAVAFFGEKYVTANTKLALLKLVAVFTIGFGISCFFGHMFLYGLEILEACTIIAIMGIVTYLKYSPYINKKTLDTPPSV